MDATLTVYVISEGSYWLKRNEQKLLARYSCACRSIGCKQALAMVRAGRQASFILDLENPPDREAMFSLINEIEAATQRGDGYWPAVVLVSNGDFFRLANCERHSWIWVHASGESSDDLQVCIEHVLGLRRHSHNSEPAHRGVLQVLAQ